MAKLDIRGVLEKSYPDPKFDKNFYLIIREDEKYKGRDGSDQKKSQLHCVAVYGKDGQESQTIRAAKALQPGQWVILLDVKVESREWDGKYYTNLTCYGRPMRLVAADGTVEYTQPRQQQAPLPGKTNAPSNLPPGSEFDGDDVPF